MGMVQISKLACGRHENEVFRLNDENEDEKVGCSWEQKVGEREEMVWPILESN